MRMIMLDHVIKLRHRSAMRCRRRTGIFHRQVLLASRNSQQLPSSQLDFYESSRNSLRIDRHQVLTDLAKVIRPAVQAGFTAGGLDAVRKLAWFFENRPCRAEARLTPQFHIARHQPQ